MRFVVALLLFLGVFGCYHTKKFPLMGAAKQDVIDVFGIPDTMTEQYIRYDDALIYFDSTNHVRYYYIPVSQ